jgi:hypothetical protein
MRREEIVLMAVMSFLDREKQQRPRQRGHSFPHVSLDIAGKMQEHNGGWGVVLISRVRVLVRSGNCVTIPFSYLEFEKKSISTNRWRMPLKSSETPR